MASETKINNMGVAKYEPTKRKNYGCEREWWIGFFKRSPDSLCFHIKDMKQRMRAQAISKNILAEYNLNLDEMATKTILKFDHIKDKKLKKNVLSKMKDIIQSEHDPWTGSALDYKGLTYPMLLGIIEWCKTGKRPEKLEKKMTVDYGIRILNFNEEERELLKIMKDGGLDFCHKRLWADKATKIMNLYEQKLKGEA